MSKIQNIKLKAYRKFLKAKKCTYLRTNGGHEIWECPNCTRPIVFQTHIEPIPEFIIKQHLRCLGISKTQFLKDI
ncbi:MAG: type II toxin-antitoxin system HicA family toxin [Bacteroidales bacterium]|nr:type II toxin-antitoxin system HicA family toxin [Bacteroidales bacterium]